MLGWTWPSLERGLDNRPRALSATLSCSLAGILLLEFVLGG